MPPVCLMGRVLVAASVDSPRMSHRPSTAHGSSAARWFAIAAASLILSACGDDPDTPVQSTVEAGTTGGDVGGLDKDTKDDAGAVDTGAAVDAASVDSGPADGGGGLDSSGGDCPGGVGCACSAPAECDTTFCIATATGKECAATCTDSCPDPKYRCVQTNVGADIANICVPAFDWLCNPCNTSKQCQNSGVGDAECMAYGVNGGFCGTTCNDDAACPTGFACVAGTTTGGKPAKQCVKKDAGDKPYGTCPCSEYAVNNKLTTSCIVEHKNDKGEVVGSCAGQRVCGDKGLTTCSAEALQAEVCDGADNDCDGKTDEATCDDNNTCTTDACDPSGDGGKGKCVHNKLTGPCDADGSACTQGDKCVSGVCTPGTTKNCDDGNACTADACDPSVGCTQVADDGKGCNADDNDCTVGDKCIGGACKSGPEKPCTSNDACVTAKCNPVVGKCAFKSAAPGTACDDGSKCTSGDGCTKGDCTGTLVKCDDANACTSDSCSALTGCKHESTTLPCDDGAACTSGDVCKDDKCVSGKAISCDDGNPCTADNCDPATGKCKTKNVTAPCDDNNACTTSDVCGDGFCTGKAIKCDDANKCTNDGCDAKLGCTNKGNTQPCDDANKCTANDSCKAGTCVGLAKQATVDCDDASTCTTDSCKPAVGCVNTNNSEKCSDGNPCTTGDLCSAGKCSAGTNTCDCQKNADCTAKEDGDLCNGTLFCDKSKAPFACAINPKTIVTCAKDKDGTCVRNQCDANKATCALQPINDTKPCDADGSVCTKNDVCKAGECKAGTSVNCSDNNPCTDDSCHPKTACVNLPNTAACNADDNLCTPSDTCSSKVCVASKPKVCVDGNDCTADACDAKTGKCGYSKTALDGKACNDSNGCTVKDSCAGGICKGSGKDCDDKNACTDDSCSLAKGCEFSDASGSCEDGNPCTEGDSCGKDKANKHGCLPGKAKVCEDGNDCTIDSCDPTKGCVKKTDAGKQFDCYTGPKGSDAKGTCKKGKATCDNSGALGKCEQEVIPNQAEKCDGLDDTCDGKTDEGCKPNGIKVAYGNLRVRGSTSKLSVRAFGGSRGVVGAQTGSGKTYVRWSLLAWLNNLIKQ
jgi:hypothetical protein